MNKVQSEHQPASGVINKVRKKLLIESIMFLVLTYAFIDFFDVIKNNSTEWLSAAAFIVMLGLLNNLYVYSKTTKPKTQSDFHVARVIRHFQLQADFRAVYFAIFIMIAIPLIMPIGWSKVTNSTSGILFGVVIILSIVFKSLFERHLWRSHIKNLKKNL